MPSVVKSAQGWKHDLIVVEHQDRWTRFGFQYFETLLFLQVRAVEVVNQAEDGKGDVLQDRASSIYSMYARLYGQRCAKHQTETIVNQLKAVEGEEP